MSEMANYSTRELEERLAERTAELERQKRYLESVVQLSPTAIVTVGLDGSIVSWNPEAERLFGWSADEVVGRDLDSLIADRPELREEAESYNHAALRDGRVRAVTRRVRKNGELVDVELHAAPVILDREPIGYFAIYHDISELQAQKQYFRSLIDFSPTAVAIIDTDATVTLWNPAAEQLFGYTAAEAIGRNIDDLVATDPVLRAEAEEVSRQAMLGDARLVTRRQRKDGTFVDVQVRTAPVLVGGEVVGSYALYHDISDLVQARRDAEAATRAKSAFLAAMSHEIRTPMNAVIGMTGLLLDTDLRPEQREYAEIIQTSGEALLTIINDVLDFSKIEAGRMDVEQVPVDVRDTVEGALDLVSAMVARKGVDLAYEVDDDVPAAILSDPNRLRQVLLNLLNNAAKFTESGEIHVSVAAATGAMQQPMLHVRVRDTGVGISPDRLEQIFESFSQADASTSRRFGGTGLGLAISRRLVEMMGGQLWAESTGVPGEGSIFHFTVAAEPAEVPAGRGRSFAVPDLAGRRVLVVDDNATNRRILVAQLARWGVTPLEASSPREALEFMGRGEVPDLAIIDFLMPEMNGLELARAIRADAAGRNVPLVLFSSLGNREVVTGGREGTDGPFAAFLSKPLKPSQLHDVLVDLLSPGVPAERRGGAASTVERPAQAADTRPLRILLAEDNKVNQMLAIRLLEQLGHSADVVTNGVEAVEAVDRNDYDLVLMDVQMPEMDGLEATRLIRERAGANGRPRIVAMTANAMQGDREACLAAGMDDYIAKPIRPAELATALARTSGANVSAADD